MMQAIPGIIVWVTLFAGCGYAMARGGPPERWGAGMFFVAAVLSNVALYLSRRQYLVPEVGLMAVDGVYMVALIALALRAQRFWPMWAAALQIDTMFTHLLMFSHTTMPLSYAMMLWIWGLPMPLLIGVGAWRHRRRVNLWGSDPAWS